MVIPRAIVLMSLTQPTINGMTAPPEIAIMTRPEISLLLSGNFSIAIEKTSGHILATARPIMKTSPHANTDDLIITIIARQMIPSTDVHM